MNAALFALGLAVPLAYLPQALDATLSLRWAVMAVLAAACLTFCPRPAPVPRWPALLVVIAAVSLFWTPDPVMALDELAHVCTLFVVFWLAASVDTRPAWIGLVGGVSIVGAVAVAQVFGWDGVGQAAAPAGLFGNKNLLAEAGMVALVAALALRSYALVPFAAVAALLPESRAVYGALAFTGALWLLPNWPRAAHTLLWALGLGTAAIFAFGLISSAQDRLEIWAVSVAGFRFLGNGLGSFATNFPIYEHAHNEVVQIIYEFGVLAVPFLALPCFLPFTGPHDDANADRLILAAICAVGLFSFPLHIPTTAFAAALAAGGLARLRGWVVWSPAYLGAPIGARA